MKNFWAILICCLTLKNLIVLSFKQPYTVTQIDVENSPGNLVTSSLRLVGRDQALNGTVTFLNDLTDDVILQMDLFADTLRNGQFSPTALQIPPMDVHTNFDFQDGIVCPIPKGEYWLKNIVLDPKDWISILPNGFLKHQLTLMDNSEFAGSVAIVVNIQSKLSPV